MLPSDRLSALDLRRLDRDIGADCAAMEVVQQSVASVESRPEGLSEEAQAFLAVRIHAWYTALESILERIARTLEGSLPSGPASHRDLLKGMTLAFPDVRPAVLGADRLADLADLLAFRHFFRHVYAVELDEDQLRTHARRLLRVHPLVMADLEAFRATLRAWVEAIEGDEQTP